MRGDTTPNREEAGLIVAQSHLGTTRTQLM